MKKLKGEKGFTLISVLIAVAVLGLIAVIFAGGISTATKAVVVDDEKVTAESLAKSQIEYIKQQAYITAPDYGEVTYTKIADIPDEYTIQSVNLEGDTVSDIIGVPWDSENSVPEIIDNGLQRIFLIVERGDNAEVITLEGFKVNR
jgi:type II secretory pathway pseudopilin PulG